MSRQKKKVIQHVTLEQAQEASQLFAVSQNKLAKIEAKMNEEINRVKSKYQDDITEAQEQLSEPMEVLQVFAEEHKAEWGKKKSFSLLHSVIGFRTGMPKVAKDKKFTWDAVIELVNKAFPNLIRTKKELDKEEIIALCKEDDFSKQLKAQCYVEVVQEESFFVEAKMEELVPA